MKPLVPDSFVTFANLLPEPILLVSGEGVILAANQSWRNHFGHPLAELQGKRLDEWVVNSPQSVEQYLQACSRTRDFVIGALEVKVKTSTTLPCRSEGFVFSPKTPESPAVVMLRLFPKSEYLGNFKLLNERIEELTQEIARRKRLEEDLRQSEERFQLATRAAEIGTFDWHIPTGRVLWSDQEHRLFGIEPGTFEGRIASWANFFLSQDLAAIQALLDEAMAAQQDSMDFEFRIRRPDGEVRWIEGSARFLYREDGTPERMVGVNLDATERRLLEESLRKTADELTELNRGKDQFLAMLAHELRNPLASIRNGLYLLRQGQTDETVSQRAREMLERQTHHITKLVDDLLDVSRLSTGKIKLNRERLDLCHLVRQAVEDHQDALDASGLMVRNSLSSTPVWVEGDETRLSQVIGNLLDNSRKFTERGGTVALQLTLDSEKSLALLVVRDTGVGIEKEMLPNLFETFSQADSSLDRSKGGLGLGLAIVKGMVELHEGRVRVFSEGVGKGAEFVIELPVSTDQPELIPSTFISSFHPTLVPRSRVLIIEDNPDAAESLCYVLQADGFEVEVAHTGQAGLETACQFKPDVILCDIGLPGLDGYGVARALRKEPSMSKLKLIAMTGYGQEEDKIRAREAGFDRHLVKPVDPEQLLKTLEEHSS